MGDKVGVNWTLDPETKAVVKASADRYNATHDPKTYPGEVVAAAIRLLRVFPWVRQQEMIQRWDNAEYWAALRQGALQSVQWPEDYGPNPETQGTEGQVEQSQ